MEDVRERMRKKRDEIEKWEAFGKAREGGVTVMEERGKDGVGRVEQLKRYRRGRDGEKSGDGRRVDQ